MLAVGLTISVARALLTVERELISPISTAILRALHAEEDIIILLPKGTFSPLISTKTVSGRALSKYLFSEFFKVLSMLSLGIIARILPLLIAKTTLKILPLYSKGAPKKIIP